MKASFNIDSMIADVHRAATSSVLGAGFPWQGFFTYFYK
jgi:hypothetical protein